MCIRDRVFAQHGWCSYSTVFFNHFTPTDEKEYEISSEAEYQRRTEEVVFSHQAIGGVMGWMSCWPPYRYDALGGVVVCP